MDQQIYRDATLLKFRWRWRETRRERWIYITRHDIISHRKTASNHVRSAWPTSAIGCVFCLFPALRLYMRICTQSSGTQRPVCVRVNTNNVTCTIHEHHKRHIGEMISSVGQLQNVCSWSGGWSIIKARCGGFAVFGAVKGTSSKRCASMGEDPATQWCIILGQSDIRQKCTSRNWFQ